MKVAMSTVSVSTHVHMAEYIQATVVPNFDHTTRISHGTYIYQDVLCHSLIHSMLEAIHSTCMA